MRISVAALCGVLLACGRHAAEPGVSVHVSCGEQGRSLAVTGDQRIDDHLCGPAWSALRIEHGARTELVKAIAGREVWLRRVDHRAVIEVRAGGVIQSTFDGVTEIADDTSRARTPGIEIDANGVVSNVTLADLRTRFESAGSAGRDISLCMVAAAYVAHPRRIEVTGDESDPIVATPDECTTRGLVLRISSQGELRLRTAAGEHLLQHVLRIAVTL